MVSVGQECRHSLAGCLWFKVSHEVVIKLPPGTVVSSEGLTGEESASKPTEIVGRTQFFSTVGLKYCFLADCQLEAFPCRVGPSIVKLLVVHEILIFPISDCVTDI